MPHVFPAEWLDVVPSTADTPIAKNQRPPTGIEFPVEWSSGAEVPAAGPDSPADDHTAQDWR
jgi:hypothetical protein